jgi:NAD(P)-dependent dehydrogenase (short-subunit alcohol dehydrogenase family)
LSNIRIQAPAGAAVGMGFAAAQAFAEAGASVALADRNEPKLRAATQKLAATGHKVIGIACDMSNDAQVAATVDRAVAEFGRLDAAYNNAGVNSDEVLLGDLTDDEWQRILSIDLRSVWVCMRAELRVMLSSPKDRRRSGKSKRAVPRRSEGVPSQDVDESLTRLACVACAAAQNQGGVADPRHLLAPLRLAGGGLPPSLKRLRRALHDQVSLGRRQLFQIVATSKHRTTARVHGEPKG